MNPGKNGVDPDNTENTGSRMIMIVGMTVFPRPRDAAIVQSIKADTQYEKAMILILCMPASITAASVANRDMN